MAKSNGFIRLEGTLDNLTFYKSKDGYLVRNKGGIPKERIENDPAFQRTRENGREFGASATAGKLLRNSIRGFMLRAKDNRVTSRLTQVMTRVKNEDSVSARGARNVAQGLTTPTGRALLNGFDFNERALLSAVLYSPFTLDTITGTVEIPNLTPVNDLTYPSGATHVSLSCAFLNINFDTLESALTVSPVVNLPLDTTTATQTLTPSGVPAGSGNTMHFLLVEFFQEVNGVQYPLNNGSYNALTIIGVE